MAQVQRRLVMLPVAAIVWSTTSAFGIQFIKAERQGYAPDDLTTVTTGLDSDGSRSVPYSSSGPASTPAILPGAD